MRRALSGSLWALLLLYLVFPLLAAETSPTQPPKAADPSPFLAEKKVAIVIGISDYPPESGFPKLKYAAKDAQDLAAALQRQGYVTQLLTDQHAMKSSIEAALRQAQDQLNQGRTGTKEQGTILFMFSGHGGQQGTGMNAKQYLVTYDANVQGGDFGFPLKQVAEALNNSGAVRKMMFIDACRDLAGASKGIPALSSFRDLRQAQGIKTFFSTAPGEQSYEDDVAHNGFFTRYLLEGLSGKAATPDGLVTFDSLAAWVIHAIRTDPKAYQTPYWNQNASGDFYIAGQLTNKAALVIGIDNYAEKPLHGAIAGAKQVDDQLEADGFNATFLQNAQFSEMQAQIEAFAKDIGPEDVALFYFAGNGGIASGIPFLMAADAKLPDHAVEGKWERAPDHGISLAEVMDTVRKNHPGPNIFLLDMSMARASSADRFNSAALRREHTLVLFCCKPDLEPDRSDDGSLFSRTFVSVLKQPKMTATFAAEKIISAVFDQSNGVQYVIQIPMLPDRVYLTPSQ